MYCIIKMWIGSQEPSVQVWFRLLFFAKLWFLGTLLLPVASVEPVSVYLFYFFSVLLLLCRLYVQLCGVCENYSV